MGKWYMEDLLLQSQRVSGTRKPITIIDPHHYIAFFQRLKDASGMDLEFKAFLALSLSGGMRVTEALSLRQIDCDLIRGFCRVRVLKKKKKVEGTNGLLDVHKVYRDVKLHPVAQHLLKVYLNEFKRTGCERMFRFDRVWVHHQMKKYFGPNACAHMARHSHISWLVNEKKEPEMTVARLMEMNPRNVASYNHVNRKTKLEEIYTESA